MARPLLALLVADIQAFQLVEAVDALNVHVPALASEHHVQAWVSEARPRCCELAQPRPERRLLRDELLNSELFMGLHDARQKLEAWRLDYNQNRPHSAIGHLTPVEFANQVRTETHALSEGFLRSETVQDL